ncbi:hypothetical protein ACU686_37890 [Yinghuangia aomiensis]
MTSAPEVSGTTSPVGTPSAANMRVRRASSTALAASWPSSTVRTNSPAVERESKAGVDGTADERLGTHLPQPVASRQAGQVEPIQTGVRGQHPTPVRRSAVEKPPSCTGADRPGYPRGAPVPAANQSTG